MLGKNKLTEINQKMEQEASNFQKYWVDFASIFTDTYSHSKSFGVIILHVQSYWQTATTPLFVIKRNRVPLFLGNVKLFVEHQAIPICGIFLRSSI